MRFEDYAKQFNFPLRMIGKPVKCIVCDYSFVLKADTYVNEKSEDGDIYCEECK